MSTDKPSNKPGDVIIIARERAISTGPPSKQQEQRQYYEEQPMPQGELTMEKSGVSKMLVVSGAVAAIAGGYYGVKFYKSRQEGLVRDFAYSMMLYWVSSFRKLDLFRHSFGDEIATVAAGRSEGQRDHHQGVQGQARIHR
jgi:hypothetical protein